MKQQTLKGNGQQNKDGGRYLEQHSQNNEDTQARRILEGQLRECFGRVVYSHKTHEKCVEILLDRFSRIKIWQIILSALTTGGFIAAFFGAGKTGASIGALISILLLTLNLYTKNFDLGEIAQKHKQAANDTWLIREKYLSLLTDLRMGIKPLNALQEERDKLLDELHAVYEGSPSTTYKAYKKAQAALKVNEDLTFSDEEINAFLPKELKRDQST
jgi:hypothetical protein